MRLIDADYVTGKLNEINGTAELDKAFETVENAPTVDVFDKIRAEINGLIRYYPYPVVSPYQTNFYAMLMKDEVLQIIDKYRNEVNE